MSTILDVARRAGVSVSTVSHVLNDTRYVSEELRQRVLSAVDELGYQPNALARSLRMKRSHTIGMILPDNTNPYFAEIARSIEDASHRQGYSAILCNTDGDPAKELTYIQVLLEKQVDGIILVSVGGTGAQNALLQNSTAVVMVDRADPLLYCDSVQVDNVQGGWLATRHLLDLGHRHIPCLGGPSTVVPSDGRVLGYRNAMCEIPEARAHIRVLEGDFHADSGYELTRMLLDESPMPTAIFACNDLMAIGAMRAIQERGLRIPQNISVVGFDDITLSRYITPPLTTIAQPKYKMGQLALQLLLERINEKKLPTRFPVLECELIVRASTQSLHSDH